MSAQNGRLEDFLCPVPPARGLWHGAMQDGLRHLAAMVRNRYRLARLDDYQLIDPLAGRYWLVPRRGEAQAKQNHHRR